MSSREVPARRLVSGRNALLLAPPCSAWSLLLDQMRSLIVALLAVAALVSVSLGDPFDAGAIAVVLVLNIAIGFGTEWRARKSVEALRSLDAPQATVLRDGREQILDARELVPGDLVLLEPGDAVPADVRLLRTTELTLNESALTGESVPVDKQTEAVAGDALLPERSCMAYKGALVVRGTGLGIVVAIGIETEVGRISELVQRTPDEQTPLERRLEQLGRRLVGLTLGVVGVVVITGLLRGGDPWLMLETGIALAVAAVPEGLPVVAVIALAVGMRRMAKRSALVRRLNAVEALGSVTVVCTDKTGTLTAGEMTATRLCVAERQLQLTGRGYACNAEFLEEGTPLDPCADKSLRVALEVSALANRARLTVADGIEGDPTEAALLVMAASAGVRREELLEERPELGEVPFSSERMLMGSFHGQPGGGLLLAVKGAPQRVLDVCGFRLGAQGEQALTDSTRRQLATENDQLADAGLRVLALAVRELPADAEMGPGALNDLVFVGHVGLMDPPTEGVKQTVDELRRAGIRTIMITGDQERTAVAVARQLGVLRGEESSLEGSEIEALSEEQLAAALKDVAVLSRTSPEQKLRIVQGLQSSGAVVGMLGDGVNDAPALKGADVGVAMGKRGTDIARETADVVLADDRLQTVAIAVAGGRVIDDNIRKFVFYLFSSNLSEILVLFLASLVGWPLPLLPLQILWINLVSDVFPALALALEPAESDVMRRPPRDPSRRILSGSFMWCVGLYAALITAVSLSVFAWALSTSPEGSRRPASMAFLVVAMAQLLHALNARTKLPVLFSRRLWSNPWMTAGLGLSVGLMVAAVQVPALREVLGVQVISGSDALIVLACALIPLLAGQFSKWVQQARSARSVEPG